MSLAEREKVARYSVKQQCEESNMTPFARLVWKFGSGRRAVNQESESPDRSAKEGDTDRAQREKCPFDKEKRTTPNNSKGDKSR